MTGSAAPGQVPRISRRSCGVRATIFATIPSKQIASDFQKSCQSRESKIFRFRSCANQSHNAACLTADEGRWPSSRTRGEMRWTQTARWTRASDAYGEVVWFRRRGAGAKLAIRSAGDGGKRAVLREEHEVSRKAIAQGRPECSRCPVCSCACFCLRKIARGTVGAASTRSSLRPLFGGRQFDSKARTQCAARSSPHIQCHHPRSARGMTRAGDFDVKSAGLAPSLCLRKPPVGRLDGREFRPGPPFRAWNPDERPP
jgi:hypothetical protein